MRGSAVFSQLGAWTLRHRLDRWWRDGPRALICMANPSRAGATEDDATIRRLLRLTNRLNLAGFTVVNVEPFVASVPADLRRWCDMMRREWAPDYAAVSAANAVLIRRLSRCASLRIVAWGGLVAQTPHRITILRALSLDGSRDLYAFGTTRDGSPKHPLARGRHRIADDVEPFMWMPAGDGVT